MSSFFEDFRKNFHEHAHTAVWRPYSPAILYGRAQRASNRSIKSPVLHLCYTAVQHGPCYTAVCIGLYLQN